MLLNKGFRELVLTGINTALYGTEPEFDFQREPGEEGLNGLEAVIRRWMPWRGISGFASVLSDCGGCIEHIERIVQYDKLCHHLHLSLQSGSDAILESMNRHYNREDYFKIVRSLRDFDPCFGITTDIIVGFPGETEADFEDTLDAVRKSNFGKVHAFRYSARKGTKAAGFKDMISGRVKSRRAGALEEQADEISKEFFRRNLNREDRVLVERHENGMATGYTGNYIKVYIPDEEETLDAGGFVSVR